MIIIATYSNVSVTYTADGTQTVFSFPFDYLRKAFVFVEVNEETILTQGTDYSVSNKTVVFTTAPTAGTVLRIFRQTDTSRLVSWADASVLRAKDMTIQQIQELHLWEENRFWVQENAIIRSGHQWNARNFPIKNVGDPVDAKDAVNKDYADSNFMKLDDAGDSWEGRGLPVENIATPGKVKDATTKEYVDNLIDKLSVEADRYVVFNTVAAMKAADLPAGYNTRTLGYHDINDGGAGVYSIRGKVAGETEDGGSVIFLDNGNVAELITDGTVNVKQFGAKGDGVTDDSNALKAACNYGNSSLNAIFVPAGLYICKVTLNSTVDIFGVGEPSTIRWTETQSDGLIITDAYLHDMGFEMENDFSGNLVHAKSINPGSFPGKIKVEHISFACNNTNPVGTLLRITMNNTYGGVFNDISMKRYSMYYDYPNVTQKCENGLYFTTPNWVTGSMLSNIIIDVYALKPLSIICAANNTSSDITLMNSQIQCRHSNSFRHTYMTKIAYVGRMKIFNAKIWDYEAAYVENAVIYYSCSDLVTFYSPLYEKYSSIGVDPFYVEGGVNVYGNSYKLYNSELGEFGVYKGLPYEMTLTSTDDKIVPVFIKGGTTANLLYFDIEMWSIYGYIAGSSGGDAYLHIKYFAHIYNKNFLYQYNYTTNETIVYKIKRYREGVVIWVKGGSSRKLVFNLKSLSKPMIGTGMTVTNTDNTTETLEELNRADYQSVPISKNLTIVNGFVIDQNTVIS